jgi:hypothetical protein
VKKDFQYRTQVLINAVVSNVSMQHLARSYFPWKQGLERHAKVCVLSNSPRRIRQIVCQMNIELHSSSFDLLLRDERGAGRRIGLEVGVVRVGSDEPDFAIFEIGQELGVLFGVDFSGP